MNQGHEIRSLVLGLKAWTTHLLIKLPSPQCAPPPSPGDLPVNCINASQLILLLFLVKPF